MDFNFNNHGTLIREEVAQLLRSADIFLDLSDYQAFGRTGLEAMACGCTVVLPTKGGVDEYAINRENALLVDTTSEEACYNAATELVSNSELRKKLRKNSIMKAAEYSISKAAASELTVFKDSFKKPSKPLEPKSPTMPI
jgi:glycosyltransferase involved in cell wall biosynthesis